MGETAVKSAAAAVPAFSHLGVIQILAIFVGGVKWGFAGLVP